MNIQINTISFIYFLLQNCQLFIIFSVMLYILLGYTPGGVAALLPVAMYTYEVVSDLLTALHFQTN